MKFKQSEKDGSCEIVFTEKECQIIQKNKSLYLSPEFLRHFGNNLVKIVMEFNRRIDPSLQTLNTFENTEIETKKPTNSKV
tara:strand:- start:3913 stop:4155 length:243 start_codon:yes stop_codon:yes gene_type:complete